MNTPESRGGTEAEEAPEVRDPSVPASAEMVRGLSTQGREPEVGTPHSRGQAREILARVRPAFRDHVKPHTENREGERLGGGSILNARWNHRLSRDLDVYVRLRTTEDGRRILDRAAKACGGYRIEHPTFRRIEFERNRENHVDVSFGQPTPTEGEKTAIVDGEPTRILSNAQILSGKLLGRGMTAPGRVPRASCSCSSASKPNGAPTGSSGSLEAPPAAAPLISGYPAKPASSCTALNGAAQCSSADQGRPVPRGLASLENTDLWNPASGSKPAKKTVRD